MLCSCGTENRYPFHGTRARSSTSIHISIQLSLRPYIYISNARIRAPNTRIYINNNEMCGKISRTHTFSFHLRRTPNNLCKSNTNEARQQQQKKNIGYSKMRKRATNTTKRISTPWTAFVCVHTLPESTMYSWPNFVWIHTEWCSLECAKRTTRNIENPPLRINTAEEHEHYEHEHRYCRKGNCVRGARHTHTHTAAHAARTRRQTEEIGC